MPTEQCTEDIPFSLPSLTLPTDAEGFTRSFDATSLFDGFPARDQGYRKDIKSNVNAAEVEEESLHSLSSFFACYGFVVIRNLFSAEDCVATRSAMWDILESQCNQSISAFGNKSKTTSKVKSKDSSKGQNKNKGKDVYVNKKKKNRQLLSREEQHPDNKIVDSADGSRILAQNKEFPVSGQDQNEQSNPASRFDRTLPSTWGLLKSAGKYGLSTRGPTFEPTLVSNRQNILLARALAHIIGTDTVEDVMVSHDRFTIYRATTFDDPSIDGSAFATGRKNVHLDLNPWWWLENSCDIVTGVNTLQYNDPADFIRENNMVVRSMGRHVQCVLNFADNREEDGGTIVVPAFHKHLAAFNQHYISLKKAIPFSILTPDCENALLPFAQRVTMREGSVLIWDQTLAHGSCPNNSKRCRMAQFLKAFSRSATFKTNSKGEEGEVCEERPVSRGNRDDRSGHGGGSYNRNSDWIGDYSGGSGGSEASSSSGDGSSITSDSGCSSSLDSSGMNDGGSKTFSDSRSNSNSGGALADTKSAEAESRLRLVRRASALHKELESSGALPLVSPLGMHLFGLDVLES